jgi:hypothetical protein
MVLAGFVTIMHDTYSDTLQDNDMMQVIDCIPFSEIQGQRDDE